MKQLTATILLLALLLCGCAGAGAKTETSSANAITVSSVDELLEAIGPDREIILEPGNYDLSEASGYGVVPDNSFYLWTDNYDGYGLKLLGVKNLTIRGSGADNTFFATPSRNAHVISAQNCDNLSLEGFTAGHKVVPGECCGSVVALEGCLGTSLKGLNLFGCGMIGVKADMCTDLTVTDCDIYDCTSLGLELNGVNRVVVENCRIHDLGGEYGAGSVFYLGSCTDVRIEGCQVMDNVVHSLIDAHPCDGFVVKNNRFLGNSVHSAAFGAWQAKNPMILEGNTFENNSIRIWYAEPGTQAVDEAGTLLTEEELDRRYSTEKPEADVQDQVEVRVSSVDAFLEAIAPNTKIVLESAMYDLSKAVSYGKEAGDYYYWVDNHDGPGLVISGVDNLTICAEGDRTKHTISAVPRYAYVLMFSECSNITVSGITAGHTEEPGYCTGGVLCFADSDNVLVDNCSLYGCGTLGVEAGYSGNISVTNCEIYECSYGGIQMWSVDGVNIADCTFRDLGGATYQLNSCKNVRIDGDSVPGDYYME